MSTIDYQYAQSMATQLATFEIQGAMNKANRNEQNYQTRLTAISSLEQALQKFSGAVDGLNGSGKTVLSNTAAFSSEGYASAEVATNAIAGSYQFFVEQLASSHQLAITGLSDADVDMTGSFTFAQNGSNFSIDLSAVDTNSDGTNSLEELAAAINGAADNTGVNATLVRSNGEISLVLASENTGLENAITLSTSGTSGGAFDSAIANAQELSAAQDAQVRLGGEAGMLLTNSSNQFTDIIDGVDITFTQTHSAGAQPLTIDVGRDDSATKDNVQTFISAINELFSTFDSLAASGNETSQRGPLAGDSSIRAIESMLNNTLRTEFDGKTLMEFGIVADRYGKMSIDSTRFEKAVTENPEGLETLFTGEEGLLATVGKNLDVYLGGANNILKDRKESLNSMLRRVDDQFGKIQTQYDSYYARYLKQYTNMMQTMASMEQTFGLF